MERNAIEAIIRDLEIPGKLVEVDRKSIRMDLFDDRTERLHRVDLSHNEFCDLVLDWREKLSARRAAELIGAAETA